jgi:MoaA/NifB/PqqE/SkfB family radical SAM enzyme
MNFTRSSTAEQVVRSGLDYFIAAIDGFSADTYEQYRRGGKFQKTLDNLEAILDIRKKTASKGPFVEWQFVVFKHNQHELESAREYADRVGVDYFHPIKGYIEDQEWNTTLAEFQTEVGKPESVAHCARPWTHFNVRADGGVAACCYVFYKKDDFDNIFEHPFAKVWNNDHFQTARHILTKGLEQALPGPHTVCHDCLSAGVRPSFELAEEGEAAAAEPDNRP